MVDNAEQDEIACESESDETTVPAVQEEIVDNAKQDEIARESKSDETRIAAELLLNLGLSYQNNGKIEEAKTIDISKQLESAAMKTRAIHELVTACLTLASVCSNDGDHEKAIQWYQKALNLVGAEFRDQTEILQQKILTGLGLAWANLGDTEKAIESIQEAQKSVKKETNASNYFR